MRIVTGTGGRVALSEADAAGKKREKGGEGRERKAQGRAAEGAKETQ